MSNTALAITDSAAIQQYQDRDDVRELGDRLMAMHPAALEVGKPAMLAAAQLALMLGANPLPGVNEMHVWKDNKGRPCMSLGINYWRRKAQEWGGILWQQQPRAMRPNEATEYSIPQGVTAAICRGVRTEDMIRFKALGFTTNEIWDMCGATGIGTVTANEYAKQGRPLLWTATKRAETDLLRQLFPAQFGNVAGRLTEVPATVIAVDVPEAEDAPARYTISDANADLFGDGASYSPAEVVEVAEDGEYEATPAAIDPVAAFVAQAETRPSVQAVAFANGRLTAWVNYVTDNKFNPAHSEYLAQVLDRYCSAVADNGSTHTKAAAVKARADYNIGLAALMADNYKAQPANGQQVDWLDGNDATAKQAALATLQGQLD